MENNGPWEREKLLPGPVAQLIHRSQLYKIVQKAEMKSTKSDNNSYQRSEAVDLTHETVYYLSHILEKLIWVGCFPTSTSFRPPYRGVFPSAKSVIPCGLTVAVVRTSWHSSSDWYSSSCEKLEFDALNDNHRAVSSLVHLLGAPSCVRLLTSDGGRLTLTDSIITEGFWLSSFMTGHSLGRHSLGKHSLWGHSLS